MHWDERTQALVGQGGSLPVRPDDQITHKLAMLIEGECEGLGPLGAARKFGFSKQRYFQVRKLFQERGAQSLLGKPPGPKDNYRRTGEVVRHVIRHRFDHPDASAKAIAQELRQQGLTISTRSVERILADYGLRKKTLPRSS